MAHCFGREQDAWLQPGADAQAAPFLLSRPADAKLAMAECRLGLVRRYGECAVRPSAPFSLDLIKDVVLPPEGYRLYGRADGLQSRASGGAGFLYGVYALLMRLRAGEAPASLSLASAPAVSRRVLNHWDSLDGSVE